MRGVFGRRSDLRGEIGEGGTDYWCCIGEMKRVDCIGSELSLEVESDSKCDVK